jgi:hypothetical protein
MKYRKGVTALTTIPASVRRKRIPLMRRSIIVGSTRRKPKAGTGHFDLKL